MSTSSANESVGWGTIAGGSDTEAAAVAELADRAQCPQALDLEDVYSLVVPSTHRVEIFDGEQHAKAPFRPRGTYRPATVEAFVKHVHRHFDEAHTTVWVHPDNGRIVALFNDNAAAATGWGDHRSELHLKPTDEWLFWMGKDGRLVSQTEFAEHIEQGLKEIAEPAAADMLELAQTFHASHSASFRSATRLQDGTVQVQYDEELDAAAGRSKQIPIPQEFTLALSPFLGEEPYRVTARLRYRIREGKLSLGYQLVRPNDVVRDALAQVADRLTEQFTHVFLGEPPADA